MNDNWRLTQAQVSIASDLHGQLLPNWQFADRAFKVLKGWQFKNEELCLLAVVAVDALYSTNLRYNPGSREEIARYIYRIRERLLETTEDVKPNLVEDIARQGSGNASISFASKFCHFFVSADYPIYDSFVCAALKKLIPLRERRSKKIKIEPYSEFFKTCRLMAKLGEPIGCTISMRQLDQYLWLTGNYLKVPNRSDKTQQREEGSKNEVRVLIEKYPDRFQKLLPEHLRPPSAR